MKWYQRAWQKIKQGAKNLYKGIVSNTGALAIAGIGLALGIVTGGTFPIAMAAVVLTVKLVKTGLDAHKAIKTRNLDIENSALVEYATALYVRQKMLDLQPRLLSTTKSLSPLELDDNGKKLTYNKSLNRVHKIVEGVSAALDIATVAINPMAGIHAAKHIKTGVNALELIGNAGDIIHSIDTTTELYTVLSDRLANKPEAQEQLVNLINSSRGIEGKSYLDLKELREQTQAIKNENQALVATLKEDNFYSLNSTQIREKFEEYLKEINSNALPVQKQESMAKRIWHGIKDALNPYSKYNPEIREHSGLTTAVRKENAEAVTKTPTVKAKAVTKDDFALNARTGIKSKTISAEQRKIEIERLKEDAKKLDKRMAQKAHDIGEVLHSKVHSQNRIPPRSSGTVKKRLSTSERRSH